MGKRYNLLYEPWIKVVDEKLNILSVSLIEVLENAHKYKSLAGETPLQNFAIERLLLSVAITIFYKYDENGQEALLNEDKECDFDESDEVEELVFNRWKAYYDFGTFPNGVVRNYLQKYEERFWLFHPENPFYQVPDSVLTDKKYGTEYTTKCMLGNIKESNNPSTRHHFSMVEGYNLDEIKDDEIARWLIHLMAYSVNIKVPTGTGKGRLGDLGSIKVEGDNLFNELLLNLVPIKINGNESKLWGKPKPVWERKLCIEKGVQISPPDNLPELYTIQSRRIVLKQEKSTYTGNYYLAGGDYYSTTEDPVEQMTLWKSDNDKKSPKIVPKKHKLTVQAWREFDSLVGVEESGKKPGLIAWIEKINEAEENYLPRILTVVFNGVEYDSNGSSFIGYTNDKISLVSDILNQMESAWISIVSNEIKKCEEVSRVLYYYFSVNIGEIYSLDKKDISYIHSKLSQNFFHSIDGEFRHWLCSIEPSKSSKNDKQIEWEKIARNNANKIVMDYIKALANKYKVKEGKERALSVPSAYNIFKKELLKKYPIN